MYLHTYCIGLLQALNRLEADAMRSTTIMCILAESLSVNLYLLQQIAKFCDCMLQQPQK